MPTAVALLGRLDEVEGLIVTTVSDEQPAWVPERLRDMVLTPADAKGLEVRIDLRWRACRRRPGRWGFTRRRRRDSTSPRTAIDQLRVALNRATETLPSSTWPGAAAADALSAELLEDAAPYDADDQVAHLSDNARGTNECRRGRTTRGRCSTRPRTDMAAGVPGDAPARRPASAQRCL